MSDFKKEWFAKARIDYFSPFVSLWLSCNSWYTFHYATLKMDREHVNNLKSDFTNQNKVYKAFQALVKGAATKEQLNLFANLEQLHYALSRFPIKPDRLIYPLSLEHALMDYVQKGTAAGYLSLLVKGAKTKGGKLKARWASAIDLGSVVLIADDEKVFAGLFEIIYQVRCYLVHGHLPPNEDAHEVVKYCYLILYDLMKVFCG